MILADKIIEERKRNGWSQEELAEKLGVSRQAVSKWERDLSYPDVNSIPKLADIFGVSVDELMHNRMESQNEGRKGIPQLISIILKAVALAMGVGVVALSILTELDVSSGMSMLGIGVAFLAMTSLAEKG